MRVRPRASTPKNSPFTARQRTTCSSRSEYPLLVNPQPNYYRAFIVRSWVDSKSAGMVGFLHPNSHLNGTNEGPLRAACYRRIRSMPTSSISENSICLAKLTTMLRVGIHVYGRNRKVSFRQAAWLYDPSTLVGSLVHDGASATSLGLNSLGIGIYVRTLPASWRSTTKSWPSGT